jgi:hypothetical protein
MTVFFSAFWLATLPVLDLDARTAVVGPGGAGARFPRGDVNDDGRINLPDAMGVLLVLCAGLGTDCLDADARAQTRRPSRGPRRQAMAEALQWPSLSPNVLSAQEFAKSGG